MKYVSAIYLYLNIDDFVHFCDTIKNYILSCFVCFTIKLNKNIYKFGGQINFKHPSYDRSGMKVLFSSLFLQCTCQINKKR